MSGEQIIFLLIGALTLSSALMVVTTKKIMHAALWLVLALGGVAGVFATLEAGFFTVIQVAVYIGAIAILIIFALMLTRRVMGDVGAQTNKNWPIAALVAVVSLAGLAFYLSRWADFSVTQRPVLENGENIALLGQSLVALDGFIVPFEVASVLLVAALIGGLFVAGEPKKED